MTQVAKGECVTSRATRCQENFPNPISRSVTLISSCCIFLDDFLISSVTVVPAIVSVGLDTRFLQIYCIPKSRIYLHTQHPGGCWAWGLSWRGHEMPSMCIFIHLCVVLPPIESCLYEGRAKLFVCLFVSLLYPQNLEQCGKHAVSVLGE